jgi:hypothetical protein
MAASRDTANASPHRLQAKQRGPRLSLSDDSERTIVVRDRRKPNQYTTDNVIAREWLPILRVGDAFFFYSVYLSMANRETESSWGSLRTQAEYLQCSVDLIVRGNRLLEICELVHIETGNQYTSNEYYILDPPPLTTELEARIRERLDEIAEQETSQNWLSWVRQVRKALNRHRTLPDIWEERRNRRGGRPVKALRPDEVGDAKEDNEHAQADDLEKGVCDSQPPFQNRSGSNGNGDRGSQPGCLWDTCTPRVRHNQGSRDTQPEQVILTRDNEQGKEKTESSPLLVRRWLAELGVAEATIASLEDRYSSQYILQQLEWLRYRNPRDPAAMLVSAVQGHWDPPPHMPNKEDKEQGGAGPMSMRKVSEQDYGSGEREDFPGAAEPGGPGADEAEFVLGGTKTDVRGAWAQLLTEMRMQMTRVTFDTWLVGTEVTGVRDDLVSVLVRDRYAAEWLQARWEGPIERTLSGILGCPVSVRFLSRGGRN